MNKNLPVEIWGMIEDERRKAFRRRVEEFEGKFEYSVGWWFVWHRWYFGNEAKIFPLSKAHVISRIIWETCPPRMCVSVEEEKKAEKKRLAAEKRSARSAR